MSKITNGSILNFTSSLRRDLLDASYYKVKPKYDYIKDGFNLSDFYVIRNRHKNVQYRRYLSEYGQRKNYKLKLRNKGGYKRYQKAHIKNKERDDYAYNYDYFINYLKQFLNNGELYEIKRGKKKKKNDVKLKHIKRTEPLYDISKSWFVFVPDYILKYPMQRHRYKSDNFSSILRSSVNLGFDFFNRKRSMFNSNYLTIYDNLHFVNDLLSKGSLRKNTLNGKFNTHSVFTNAQDIQFRSDESSSSDFYLNNYSHFYYPFNYDYFGLTNYPYVLLKEYDWIHNDNHLKLKNLDVGLRSKVDNQLFFGANNLGNKYAFNKLFYKKKKRLSKLYKNYNFSFPDQFFNLFAIKNSLHLRNLDNDIYMENKGYNKLNFHTNDEDVDFNFYNDNIYGNYDSLYNDVSDLNFLESTVNFGKLNDLSNNEDYINKNNNFKKFNTLDLLSLQVNLANYLAASKFYNGVSKNVIDAVEELGTDYDYEKVESDSPYNVYMKHVDGDDVLGYYYVDDNNLFEDSYYIDNKNDINDLLDENIFDEAKVDVSRLNSNFFFSDNYADLFKKRYNLNFFGNYFGDFIGIKLGAAHNLKMTAVLKHVPNYNKMHGRSNVGQKKYLLKKKVGFNKDFINSDVYNLFNFLNWRGLNLKKFNKLLGSLDNLSFGTNRKKVNEKKYIFKNGVVLDDTSKLRLLVPLDMFERKPIYDRKRKMKPINRIRLIDKKIILDPSLKKIPFKAYTDIFENKYVNKIHGTKENDLINLKLQRAAKKIGGRKFRRKVRSKIKLGQHHSTLSTLTDSYDNVNNLKYSKEHLRRKMPSIDAKGRHFYYWRKYYSNNVKNALYGRRFYKDKFLGSLYFTTNERNNLRKFRYMQTIMQNNKGMSFCLDIYFLIACASIYKG